MSYYEDPVSRVQYTLNLETLYLAPSGLTNVVIKSSTKYIRGTSQSSYAFINCNTTFASFSFEKNPQLEEIQNYAFLYCFKLQQIDLSLCTKLIQIGQQAFLGCTSVSSLKLPQSLTTLGPQVFQYINITTIKLPSSLTIIPNQCFYNCYSLETIIIPNDVQITSLGYNMIANTKVRTFNIPSLVATINEGCFEYAYLESITISSSNNFKIQNNAVLSYDGTILYGFPLLITGTAYVPQGVKKILKAAFGSTSISHVELPNSLQYIGSYAFYKSKIVDLVIPDTVTTINLDAFDSCTLLRSVKLSANCKSLSTKLFQRTAISSIEFPPAVQIIDKQCFAGCTNLLEVTLPDNITYLAGNAFPSTTKIKFGQNSNLYLDPQLLIISKNNQTINGYIGDNEAIELSILSSIEVITDSVFENRDKISKIIFPSNSKLTTIKQSAFSNCKNLVFVNLPTIITEIGKNAFFQCFQLESISLNYAASLGQNSFTGCSKLRYITFFSSNLTDIPESAFSDCISLVNIDLPSNISSISGSAFSGCSNLERLTINGNSLSFIGSRAFAGTIISKLDFSKCVNFISLGIDSLSSMSSLAELILPPNLATISDFAVQNSAITSLTFPESLKKIGLNSFADCQYLEVINIPSGSILDSIGIGAFRGCMRLRQINSQSSNYRVVTGALFTHDLISLVLFPPASLITSFSLPGDTKFINEGAFLSCTNLESIFIPSDSISRISTSAFEGCTSLSWINIPICVTSVGLDAFKGCSKLLCGISVENKSKSYLDNLFTNAHLSKLSIKPCQVSQCTMNCVFYTSVFSSSISMIAVMIIM